MADALLDRGDALGALDGLLAELVDGQSATAVVAGEPGHGKTALFDALSTRCDRDGVLLLRGTAPAIGGRNLAFAPVASALARHLETLDDERRTDLVTGLPSLGRLIEPVGPRPAPADPDLERMRVFQSTALLLGRLAVDQPVLLAVDDLHWADADSVELLAFLRAELASLPIGLAVAVRLGDVGTRSDISHLLVELRRRPRGRFIELLPLDATATAQLVGDVLQQTPPPTLVEAVLERTGGVPLAVLAVARELAAGGAVDDVTAASLPVPAFVVDVFVERVASLEGTERAVLSALAAGHRPVTSRDLAVLTGASGEAVADALRGLQRRALVAPVNGGYDVAHPLVRDATGEAEGEGERRAAHRAWVELLQCGGASAGEVAVHVVAADDRVPDADAFDVLRAAGEAALAEGASDAAVRYLSEAVERGRRLGDTAELGRSLARLAVAWELRGELGAAAAARAESTDLLADADPAAASAQAARVAVMEWGRGRFDAVEPWQDRATELARRAGPLAQVRVLAERVQMCGRLGRYERMDALAAELQEAAAAVPSEPDVELTRFSSTLMRAFVGRRPIAGLARELPAGWRAGSSAHRYTAVGVALEAFALEGDWAGVDALLRDSGTDAGDGFRSWRLDRAAFDLALAVGEWGRAEDLVTAWTASAIERSRVHRLTALGTLAAYRGDTTAAADALDECHAVLAGGRFESYAADLASLSVLVADARGDVATAAVRPDAWDEGWVAMREPVVRAAQGQWLAAIGDRSGALAVAERLAAIAGPRTRAGAIATRLRGLATDDRALLLEAADTFARLGMPFEAARARLEAVQTAPGPADAELLAPEAETFAALGASPWLARATRITGRTVVPAGIGLTPREWEVARLVAEGLTNAQIAERLVVSIRTVTSHLDHAYTKLGINTRTALAAYVLRSGSPVT